MTVIWIGLDWIGLDWIGLDWIGLDWIGLDWIGLDWIGLDWIGLNQEDKFRGLDTVDYKQQSIQLLHCEHIMHCVQWIALLYERKACHIYCN